MSDGCQSYRELLHDRLDGRLADAERPALERHLEACDGCRAELAALELLSSATSQLPAEVEPSRDLWPGIERRLELPWWRRVFAALPSGGGLMRPAPLMTALAGAAMLVFGLWLWRQEAAPMPSPAVTAEQADTSRMTERAELARFEDGMLLAHQDLLAAVESQSDQLSPETVAAIEENMRIIDQAIGQIRTALEEDPFNQRLNMLLAAQYQREVGLLKRLSGV